MGNYQKWILKAQGLGLEAKLHEGYDEKLVIFCPMQLTMATVEIRVREAFTDLRATSCFGGKPLTGEECEAMLINWSGNLGQ